MTAAVELVARLRARGVILKPDGATLVVRPADAVSPDEVAALRRHKPELLALLTAPPRPWVNLDPAAVREALGPDADEHELACLSFDVLAAVIEIEREILSGAIGTRPRLVRGRPLADWLALEDVARLLRLWREQRRERR